MELHVILENELQPELDIARRVSRCDRTEVAVRDIVLWSLKVHVIEGIDEVGAKLQAHRLFNGEEPRDREIVLLQAGVSHVARACSAKPALRGRGKGRRIEPAVCAGIWQESRIADVIRLPASG